MSLHKFQTVLCQVSNAVKKHHNHINSYKKTYNQCGSLSFRSLLQYHHDMEHASKKADMILVQGLRFQHLEGNRKLTEKFIGYCPEHRKPQSPPLAETHLLQDGTPMLTKPYLLILTLPLRLWVAIAFKLP